jgi:hypothetical protein
MDYIATARLGIGTLRSYFEDFSRASPRYSNDTSHEDCCSPTKRARVKERKC